MGGHLDIAGGVLDALPGLGGRLQLLDGFAEGFPLCPGLGQRLLLLRQPLLQASDLLFQILAAGGSVFRTLLQQEQAVFRPGAGCPLLLQGGGSGVLLCQNGVLLLLIFPGNPLEIIQHVLTVETTDGCAAELTCVFVHSKFLLKGNFSSFVSFYHTYSRNTIFFQRSSGNLHTDHYISLTDGICNDIIV